MSRLAVCVTVLVVVLMAAGDAAAQLEPTANDGQHLSDQPSDIQALFVAVWGPTAAQEWANERNVEIARNAGPAPAPQHPGMAGPQVTISQPTTGQNVWTSSDFVIRGTATDPNAGPAAVDRVEVWLNGWRNTHGAVQVGVATVDSGGAWSLSFSPTKFTAMNSNLYVYGHSTYSGNTTVNIVNFNIADHR